MKRIAIDVWTCGWNGEDSQKIFTLKTEKKMDEEV
jgi:hypothetical protein